LLIQIKAGFAHVIVLSQTIFGKRFAPTAQAGRPYLTSTIIILSFTRMQSKGAAVAIITVEAGDSIVTSTLRSISAAFTQVWIPSHSKNEVSSK
jgi:hypothetical protein